MPTATGSSSPRRCGTGRTSTAASGARTASPPRGGSSRLRCRAPPPTSCCAGPGTRRAASRSPTRRRTANPRSAWSVPAGSGRRSRSEGCSGTRGSSAAFGLRTFPQVRAEMRRSTGPADGASRWPGQQAMYPLRGKRVCCTFGTRDLSRSYLDEMRTSPRRLTAACRPACHGPRGHPFQRFHRRRSTRPGRRCGRPGRGQLRGERDRRCAPACATTRTSGSQLPGVAYNIDPIPTGKATRRRESSRRHSPCQTRSCCTASRARSAPSTWTSTATT